MNHPHKLRVPGQVCRRRFLLSYFTALSFISGLPERLPASPILSIDADHSVVITHHGGGNIAVGGTNFKLGVKHHLGETIFLPVVTNLSPLPGRATCFYFRLDPFLEKGTAGEKMLVDVAHIKDPWAPRFGQTNTLGFSLRLSRSFQEPLRHLMVSEWWQGSPYGPPVQLHILSNGTRLALLFGDGHGMHGWAGPVLERERWYRIALTVVPDWQGKGHLRLSLDDQVIFSTNDVVTAYDPSHPLNPKYGKPLNGFYVEVGLYRGAEPRRGDCSFDGIRWGVSPDDVKP